MAPLPETSSIAPAGAWTPAVARPPFAKKAPVAWVAVPLQKGQEVVVRRGGIWRAAVVMRPPRGRGAVGVVETDTWTERQVPLTEIAIKASLACAIRRSPKAAVKHAKAAEARIARVEQRVKAANATTLNLAASLVGRAAPPGPDAAASPPAAPDAEVAPEPAVVLKRNRCRPEKAGLDARALKKVDEALHARVERNEMPGVVNIVYRHGVLAHMDCHGYADIERKVPMRPDSIVRLYSMTKCIVSVAAAVCLEDGVLRLDDLVSKFIPAFADIKVRQEGGELEPAVRPITVLHLLTHTAGMGYGPMLGDEADGEAEERFLPVITRAGRGRTSPSDPSAITTLEQWCNEIATVPLRSQPGAEWFYSYSHDVVGRVVEVVTGQRLDAFLQRRVLGPLGMVDTGFEVPREKWDRVAGMYRRFEVEAVRPPGGGAAVQDVAMAPAVAEATKPTDSDADPTPRTDANSASPAPRDAERDGVQEPAQPDDTVYELRRLDSRSAEANEWMAGNASPILSGGGSVDAMTGGLVSTAADYSRFCLMLLRRGELDGVRILKEETVDLLCTNQLPAATGKSDAWAFSTPGVGFGLIGSVSVEHPELDSALRPGEYGWGGMAGTAWTNDPREDFFLLSFSLTAFDLTTEEELRGGVRAAIAQFDQRREKAEMRRMERAEKEQRRVERLAAAAPGLARTTTPTKRPRSPASAAKRGPQLRAASADLAPKRRRSEAEAGAVKSPDKTSPPKTPTPARSEAGNSVRKAAGNLQRSATEPQSSPTDRRVRARAGELETPSPDGATASMTPRRVRLHLDRSAPRTACTVSA